MDLLGLSEIESLRNELKCREGLLIDFDYGAALSFLESKLALAGSEHKLDGVKMNMQQEEGKGKGIDKGVPLGGPTPDASGTRTVCFSNSTTLLHLLRNLAGHCSLHFNRITYPRCTTPCCPRFGICILCPAFHLQPP
jgi:hypothetical protein